MVYESKSSFYMRCFRLSKLLLKFECVLGRCFSLFVVVHLGTQFCRKARHIIPSRSQQ